MIAGYQVIDFHGHVGRWDAFAMGDDPAPMLRAMDAVGIDRSCLFNIFHPDGRSGNDQTAAFVAQHPDRFIGFAYVSPMLPETVGPELKRAIDELGFKAIKIYSPYTPYPLDHPAWDPARARREQGDPARGARAGRRALFPPAPPAHPAPRAPTPTFVAAHAGNAEPFRGQAIAAAQAWPNFYLETCSTFRIPGVVEELVSKAGAARVLFGSDVPLMDPRPQLGKIITADIDAEAKRLVLGANAHRLLKL